MKRESMPLARLHEVSPDRIMPDLRAFAQKGGGTKAVRTVILFGSLAREEMTEASDVDLAIIVDDGADLRGIKEHVRRLKAESFSWPCDLVVLNDAWFQQRKTFGGVCMEIDQGGLVLYQRHGG
jgi:predicted nucleotidyltransferase